MNEFELITLRNEFGAAITDQFNFWMATTFAIVIASHTVGDRLNRTIRLGIALLYSLACVVFFLRYLAAVDHIILIDQSLREIGSDLVTRITGVTTIARRIVMIGGSILGVLLILRPSMLTTNDNASNDA